MKRCTLDVLYVHFMGFLAVAADAQVLQAANASLHFCSVRARLPMARADQCGRAGATSSLFGAVANPMNLKMNFNDFQLFLGVPMLGVMTIPMM